MDITGSPISLAGTVVLAVTFVVAVAGAALGIVGNARGRERWVAASIHSLYALGALVTLASSLMIYAFVTHDFAIRYVWGTSDTSMSTWYKVTAFWGGLEGSLLFWILTLGLFSTVAVRANVRRHADMIGYVVGVILLAQVFFIALILYTKNPFASSLTAAPADGKGLNPLLQNYWMIIHPPALYVGFVAATIPFAFAIGALASGRLDDTWLVSVRAWTLVCFLFLTLGLILGGRWAYEELGWGGYWAWDPVENAGFLPWFTATALLHSAIVQEQRGTFRIWNMVLVILTFFLTIFGTFMTRAGVVQSVHSFGEDKELAMQFILFMVTLLVFSLGLVAYRARVLHRPAAFESLLSRDFAFLLNNWILLGCGFFVLGATMFPTFTEHMTGDRYTVGPDVFNRMMTLPGLILVFLAGAAPLLAWRKTTRARFADQFTIPLAVSVVVMALLALFVPAARAKTALFSRQEILPIPLIAFGICAFVTAAIVQEFVRGARVRGAQAGTDAVSSLLYLLLTKRRRYGGYIVHLGIVVLFIGFAGKTWETKENFSVPAHGMAGAVVPRESTSWFHHKGYSFLFEDLTQTSDDAKTATTARVSLWRGGQKLETLMPATWAFHKSGQPTTEVAFTSRHGIEDVYIVLNGQVSEMKDGANFTVFVNPLILWVWIGAVLTMLGTLMCLIPWRMTDLVPKSPSTTVGKLADTAVVVLIAAGLVGISAKVGWSAPPIATSERVMIAQAGEHEAVRAAGGGHVEGAAHVARPTTPLAERLMRDLVCMCGGCSRETLFDCKCGFAANERIKVLEMLGKLQTGTPTADQAAYDAVVADFIREYGGEHVLIEPPRKGSFALIGGAVVVALILLLVSARTWVRRGSARPTAPAAVETTAYADRLEDDLREVE